MRSVLNLVPLFSKPAVQDSGDDAKINWSLLTQRTIFASAILSTLGKIAGYNPTGVFVSTAIVTALTEYKIASSSVKTFEEVQGRFIERTIDRIPMPSGNNDFAQLVAIHNASRDLLPPGANYMEQGGRDTERLLLSVSAMRSALNELHTSLRPNFDDELN